MSLRTSIAGVPLECCVYNASGPKSGHVSDLTNVANSRSGAILSKSATLIKQSGNPLPRLKQVKMGGSLAEGSINSEGLPNAGIDYYVSSTVLDAVAASGAHKNSASPHISETNSRREKHRHTDTQTHTDTHRHTLSSEQAPFIPCQRTQRRTRAEGGRMQTQGSDTQRQRRPRHTPRCLPT